MLTIVNVPYPSISFLILSQHKSVTNMVSRSTTLQPSFKNGTKAHPQLAYTIGITRLHSCHSHQKSVLRSTPVYFREKCGSIPHLTPSSLLQAFVQHLEWRTLETATVQQDLFLLTPSAWGPLPQPDKERTASFLRKPYFCSQERITTLNEHK